MRVKRSDICSKRKFVDTHIPLGQSQIPPTARLCEACSNTPNFSWGSFSFSLSVALAALLLLSSGPRRHSRREWRRKTGVLE